MNPPRLAPLESCGSPALYGGKAVGLARLIKYGFRVPSGICVSTRVLLDTMQTAGFNPNEMWSRARRSSPIDRDRILKECRSASAALTIPSEMKETLERMLKDIAQTADRSNVRWAVRSSATNEDGRAGSFAGLYKTSLDVSLPNIPAAIQECWASLWTPAAFAYEERLNMRHETPAMAVIVQLMLSPRVAGVAYSHHPVTGDRTQVVINSILGVGEPLVSGRTEPDTYTVSITSDQPHVIECLLVDKDQAIRSTSGGTQEDSASKADQNLASLTQEEAIALARLVKEVERAIDHPVDVEWAIEEHAVWLLQARRISKPSHADTRSLTDADCAWSRANFKETLPEQPSPLGLWFLRQFMETNILSHYAQLGCAIPAGLSAVRVIHERPYINVTLFQSFIVQLGGDPNLVMEHMGGEASSLPFIHRLPWWKRVKAGLIMEWKLRQAARRSAQWFAEMKSMTDELKQETVDSLSPDALLARLDQLGERLSACDLTFAIVAGVSQGFSVLQRLLERRVGDQWRPLLNGALQGMGTVISARQILWLAELADVARQNPIVAEFFTADPWRPERLRTSLLGTHFLQRFDEYLHEYGHRALGESDVMSSRFSEIPDYVLSVIRRHVVSPSPMSAQKMRAKQAKEQEQALGRIRNAFGGQYHEWCFARLWLARLGRFLALREANRHHLIYFTAAVRRLLLALGQNFVGRQILNERNDIFFLTIEEIRTLVLEESTDWKVVIASRRAARETEAAHMAPDFIPSDTLHRSTRIEIPSTRVLKGLSVSTGLASGPVRLVCSVDDYPKVQQGDILVTSVIDPGMAPLFGLASGIIAEMGGILSHGAIIAREYGIPAVVNIPDVTKLVTDGQMLLLDATVGHVSLLRRDHGP